MKKEETSQSPLLNIQNSELKNYLVYVILF